MKAQNPRLSWLTAMVVLSAASASADSDLARLLKQPLSPGALAILVAHRDAPETQARWREGLQSGDTDIRASAARAIYAAQAASLLPDLEKALPAETEPSVAAEILLAALALGGNDRAAAGDGASAPTFRPLRLTSMNLGEAHLANWNLAWESERLGRAVLDDALIAAALRSENAGIRASTYWNLALDEARPPSMSETVVQALAATPEAEAQAASATAPNMASLAFELLARARGKPPTDYSEWLASLHAAAGGDGGRLDVAPVLLGTGPALRVGNPVLPGPIWEMAPRFTRAERALLARHWQLPKDVEAQLLAGRRLRSPIPVPEWTKRFRPLVDLYRGFPRGFVTGLASAAECRPKDRIVVDAQVEYELSGRPRVLERSPAKVPKACVPVVDILLGAHRDMLVQGQHELRLSFDRDELECVRTAAPESFVPASLGTKGAGGTIREPKKIHDVKPEYSEVAKVARQQGLVVMDMLVNPCGGVSDVRVARSATELLDAAAVRAVYQWRYEPTLLNGKPVPVRMTATANFSLR